MDIGRVVGRAWATKKDDKLNGQRFLMVKLLLDEHRERDGLYVAADNIGAGTGDLVLICKGGAARQSLGDPGIPVDAVIVAIIDNIEVDDG
ncbi:MAG: EutN/CcmL family microcompartment protein [Cellulosilyticaceae bacterium]